MPPILTLTLNPCVDSACEAETVRHTHKTRTDNPRYDPGGGGINVARVIAEMGGEVAPIYLRGGATGALLDELLAPRRFAARWPLDIAEHTRISTAIFERSTGREYRFTPEGPHIAPEEWRACLDLLAGLEADWLVASGSAPHGLGEDCLAQIGALAGEKGARFVLDGSGPAFAAAMRAGGVFLAKPSLGEFRALTGRALESAEEIEAAAGDLITAGGAQMLAVTCGHEGALLATREDSLWLTPPPEPVQSAVGAGDSFLGAIVWRLAQGDAPKDAFRWGVAAGSAAVLTPGTELCRRVDVERLEARLRSGGTD